MSKYLETRFYISAGNIYGFSEKRIKLIGEDKAEIYICGYKIKIEKIEEEEEDDEQN